MATPLSGYADFVSSTGPAFFTGPKQIVNESQRTTHMLKRLLSGDYRQHVQGGSKIVDEILLNVNSSYRSYHIDESQTWDDPQVLTRWEIPWRFSVNHYKVTGPEVELNGPGGMSLPGAFHQYKDIRYAKEQNCFTGTVNGMEDELVATPSYADMEAASGKEVYSLPALISEHAAAKLNFGLSSHTQTAANLPGVDPVWAALSNNLQGIDVTAHSRKWHNQKETYDSYGDLNDVTVGTNFHLFTAFSNMYRKLKFEALPQYPGYAERMQQPGAIFTSNWGAQIYEFGLQVNQEHFRWGKSDPAYQFPMYRNVDVVHLESLDDAAVYTDLSTGTFVAEDALSTLNSSVPDTSAADGIGFDGPRFYFVNGQYLKKTMHARRYFHAHKVIEPTDKLETMIFPYINYHNNHLRSRMRQGIVSPFANIDAAA